MVMLKNMGFAHFTRKVGGALSLALLAQIAFAESMPNLGENYDGMIAGYAEKNQPMQLMDENGTPIAETQCDEEGRYGFSHLKTGENEGHKYTVFSPEKNCHSQPVHLTQDQPYNFQGGFSCKDDDSGKVDYPPVEPPKEDHIVDKPYPKHELPQPKIIKVPVIKVVKVPVEKIVKVPVEKIVKVPVTKVVKVPVTKIVKVPVTKIIKVPAKKKVVKVRHKKRAKYKSRKKSFTSKRKYYSKKKHYSKKKYLTKKPLKKRYSRKLVSKKIGKRSSMKKYFTKRTGKKRTFFKPRVKRVSYRKYSRPSYRMARKGRFTSRW